MNKQQVGVTLVGVIVLFIVMIILFRPNPDNYLSKTKSNVNNSDTTKSELSNNSDTTKLKSIKQESPWTLGNFADSFGDITDISYISTESIGTYSNSAVSSGYLSAELLIKNRKLIGIFLSENGRPNETLIGSSLIKFKNSDNIVEEIYIEDTDRWSTASGGIKINYKRECNKLINFLLKSKGIVKFSIQDEYSSVYTFAIDVTGLKEAITELDNKNKTRKVI